MNIGYYIGICGTSIITIWLLTIIIARLDTIIKVLKDK